MPGSRCLKTLMANIYLTELDRQIESVPELHYFRNADDLLLPSPSRERAESAAWHLEQLLTDLRPKTKASIEPTSGSTMERPQTQSPPPPAASAIVDSRRSFRRKRRWKRAELEAALS